MQRQRGPRKRPMVRVKMQGLPTLKVLVGHGFVAIGVIFTVVIPLYESTIMLSKVDNTKVKYAVQEAANLLEGLPPLPNYDFPAEVAFRTSMEQAGVPNLEDFQTCPPSNMVLWRKDTTKLPKIYSKDSIRAFSFRPRDFQWQRLHRTCSTVQGMTDAIKYGKRVWENRNSSWTWLDEEWNPSSFEYHGCDIPILSPADICRILSQFSHVYFIGDSLNRHVYDGFHIALRNDFTSGSMLTYNDTLLQACRCDGQFSERLLCREKFAYPSPGVQEPFSPEYGVCPPTTVSSTINDENGSMNTNKGTIVEYQDTRLQRDALIDCSLNTTKPVLLLMNGGVHQGLKNPQLTYQTIVETLDQKQIQECARQGKLIVIWEAFIAKSPSHDVLHPNQRREKGIIFNGEMRALLSPNRHKRNTNILFVDHMNFTTGAQSIDGLHFLANTNYFKAQHYLHLADLMLKERMFSTY